MLICNASFSMVLLFDSFDVATHVILSSHYLDPSFLSLLLKLTEDVFSMMSEEMAGAKPHCCSRVQSKNWF